nr:MAG TPA: hypothetical protein [Herelleviridae sp.]
MYTNEKFISKIRTILNLTHHIRAYGNNLQKSRVPGINSN